MKIQLNNLTKIYTEEIILDELNLEIIIGEHLALVGKNGSGKSTLLKIIAGIENYQSGLLIIPKNLKIGYVNQLFLPFNGSVLDYLMRPFEELINLETKMRELEKRMGIEYDNLESILTVYEKVQNQFISKGGYELESRRAMITNGLGIQNLLDDSYNQLSGGQKTRVELAQLLISDCDVLCLDEPTNHLDLQGILWLESFIQNTKKTVILVSHDREFLNQTVKKYHELEFGSLRTYYGDYATFREQKRQVFEQMVLDYEIQQKEIQRIKLMIRRFRQWGLEGDNEDFYKRAKMWEKRLEKIEQLPKPKEYKQYPFLLNEAFRSGKNVLKLHNVSIGYDFPLVENINLEVFRKDRIAIQAPNGLGKTTLIKTILQEIPILSGTISIGSNVHFGYLPQLFHFEENQTRLLAYVQYECEVNEERARQYLATFGFYQADVFKPLSFLSGGESVRIKLLVMMTKNFNCLILDEPTNHLDAESAEIIESTLKAYDGTLIIISHDRYFLNRINVTNFYLTNEERTQ